MPTTTLTIRTVLFDAPEWEPLEKYVGTHALSDFMWMGEYCLHDDTVVHAYKNIATRRYINISADGRYWRYDGVDAYVETYPPSCFQAAYDGWVNLLPSQSDPEAVRGLLSGDTCCPLCGRPRNTDPNFCDRCLHSMNNARL